MLLKRQIQAIRSFLPFVNLHPTRISSSVLSFSGSICSVTGDFSQREISEACQLINYFSALFLYLTSDLLAALQNIELQSSCTQERFWEEAINCKMGKNYIVLRHGENINIIQTQVLEPTALSFAWTEAP